MELPSGLRGYTTTELWGSADVLACPNLRSFRESRVWITRQANPCRSCSWGTCHNYRKHGLPARTVLLAEATEG